MNFKNSIGYVITICVLVGSNKSIAQELQDWGEYENIKKEAVERIQRRLGGLATQQALQALEEKDYAKTAEICLSYYDKAYDYGLKQKKTNSVVEITLDVHHPEKAARKLIALANERIPIQ